MHKLLKAGFINSVKSELKLTMKIIFIGKEMVTIRKTIKNQPVVLTGAFIMWTRGVGSRKMSAADLLCLLGRIQLLACLGSLSCFL